MRIGIACILCLLLAAPAMAADGEGKAALEFVKNLRRMVDGGQRDAIAKLVDYPLLLDGEPVIEDAAAFVRKYDSILTARVRDCVSGHDMETPMEEIKAAYMVGNGCIWFESDGEGNMAIVAVNTKE